MEELVTCMNCKQTFVPDMPDCPYCWGNPYKLEKGESDDIMEEVKCLSPSTETTGL